MTMCHGKNPDSEDWSFSDILYYFQKAEQLTVNNSGTVIKISNRIPFLTYYLL